jgi:DNA-directed RNA polymerase subunit M/transcription elongation factor TFIIS
MFCPKCGRLSLPDAAGHISCPEPCDYSGPMKKNVKTESRGSVNLVDSTSRIEASELRHLTETIDDGDIHRGVLTNGMHVCPKCECNEVYSFLRQMDQTDEPEVAFLECKVCCHGWRD